MWQDCSAFRYAIGPHLLGISNNCSVSNLSISFAVDALYYKLNVALWRGGEVERQWRGVCACGRSRELCTLADNKEKSKSISKEKTKCIRFLPIVN